MADSFSLRCRNPSAGSDGHGELLEEKSLLSSSAVTAVKQESSGQSACLVVPLQAGFLLWSLLVSYKVRLWDCKNGKQTVETEGRLSRTSTPEQEDVFINCDPLSP